MFAANPFNAETRTSGVHAARERVPIFPDDYKRRSIPRTAFPALEITRRKSSFDSAGFLPFPCLASAV